MNWFGWFVGFGEFLLIVILVLVFVSGVDVLCEGFLILGEVVVVLFLVCFFGCLVRWLSCV